MRAHKTKPGGSTKTFPAIFLFVIEMHIAGVCTISFPPRGMVSADPPSALSRFCIAASFCRLFLFHKHSHSLPLLFFAIISLTSFAAFFTASARRRQFLFFVKLLLPNSPHEPSPAFGAFSNEVFTCGAFRGLVDFLGRLLRGLRFFLGLRRRFNFLCPFRENERRIIPSNPHICGRHEKPPAKCRKRQFMGDALIIEAKALVINISNDDALGLKTVFVYVMKFASYFNQANYP